MSDQKTDKPKKGPPHRFKPGNPGGPGRPRKKPKDVKQKKMNKTEAEALLNKFLQYDIEDLEIILKDKKRSVMEHMIGRICMMAIKHGDHKRLDFMLDRLVGRVKEVKELQLPQPTIIRRFDSNEVIELKAEEVKLIEEDL